MELLGIHHVTAITANAKENYLFYTKVLGLRLVKKTINQDDTSSYHLFYADEKGNPGTDMTFFEIPQAGATYKGVSSVSGTSLRVPDDDALTYWQDRLDQHDIKNDGITDQGQRKVIQFLDPEGQRLTLVSDEGNSGVKGGHPWEYSSVPVDKAIIGLGPTKLTVRDTTTTISILTQLLSFQQIGSYPSPVKGQEDIIVFSTGEGGTGAEIHLEARDDLLKEKPGYGSVHHVAFRVGGEEELRLWRGRLEEARMPNSGLIDRFYFRSLYFREPNGILFELATDGPGFTIDEDIESLGEALSLPPDFENKRDQIEAALTPLDTKNTH